MREILFSGKQYGARRPQMPDGRIVHDRNIIEDKLALKTVRVGGQCGQCDNDGGYQRRQSGKSAIAGRRDAAAEFRRRIHSDRTALRWRFRGEACLMKNPKFETSPNETRFKIRLTKKCLLF